MTDSIKISLDTEGTSAMLEENRILQLRIGDLEAALDRAIYARNKARTVRDKVDDYKLVAWVAVISVSLNIWGAIAWAVTR